MFYVSSDAGLTFTPSPDAGASVWDGQWHFVAGTYDGNAVHLYVDGNEIGTGTAVSAAIDYGLPNEDLFIGHYPGSCPGQNLDFAGVIDEPQVWSRAVSVSDQQVDMHPFTGFFQPVDNYPTINVAKAGSAIPVKFGLGANLGLGVLSPGSPSSRLVSCNAADPLDAIEQTVTSSTSGLQYDPTANQYIYVWKTDKTWAGSCREFDMTLGDGSTHIATFEFTR
jgi:hypothetical protein